MAHVAKKEAGAMRAPPLAARLAAAFHDPLHFESSDVARALRRVADAKAAVADGDSAENAMKRGERLFEMDDAEYLRDLRERDADAAAALASVEDIDAQIAKLQAQIEASSDELDDAGRYFVDDWFFQRAAYALAQNEPQKLTWRDYNEAERAQQMEEERERAERAAEEAAREPQQAADTGTATADSESYDGERTSKADIVATGVKVDLSSKTGGLVVAPRGFFGQAWEYLKGSARKTAVFKSFMGVKQSIEDSDNPLVQRSLEVGEEARDMAQEIKSKLLPETETALTLKQILAQQPSFDLEEFNDQIRYDFIPKFLNAIVDCDTRTLRPLCSEAVYQQLFQSMKERQASGLRLDAKVLDVRQVEMMGGAIDKGNEPALVYSFAAHQLFCVYNSKHEIVEGAPDEITSVQYTMILSFDSSTRANPDFPWRVSLHVIRGNSPVWI